jgi:hypothetical protein
VLPEAARRLKLLAAIINHLKMSRRQDAGLSRSMDLLMPLHFFYAREGRSLPPIEFVEAGGMPAFERELLAHDHDMTSTLSEYHGSALGLNVIAKEETRTYLMRLVVLERRRPPRIPVEFGAIGIRLEFFSDRARELIVACQKPLGGILDEEGIHYHSQPRAFFKLSADRLIAELLAEEEGATLWGRSNTLSDCRGEVFADIVEVLPRALAAVPTSVQRRGRKAKPRKCQQ